MIQQVIDPASYTFSPSAVPPFIVGLMAAILGLFTLMREKASLVSSAFHSICILVALWLVSLSMVLLSNGPENALVWLRVESAAATLIPTSVLVFTLATLRKIKPSKTWLAVNGIFALFFLVSSLFSERFLSGVVHYSWGYYARYGEVGYCFIGYFICVMLLSLGLFWREHRKATGVKKARLKIFIWGFGLGYISAVDYLAALGVPFFPIGYIFAAVYLVFMSLGIWRYRSIDIDASFAADDIMRVVSDAIVVVDSSGIVRMSNYAANRLFNEGQGMEGAPMISKGMPYFRKENLSRMLFEGKTLSTEITFQPAEGPGPVYLNVLSSRICDKAGTPLAIVCSIRDITRHKVAEESLRVTEAQYRLLADNAEDVIWTMDKDLRYTYISPSVQKLSGFIPEELLNMSVEESFTPASLKLFMQIIAESIAAPGGLPADSRPSAGEFELKHKGGGTVWTEIRLSFVKGDSKRPELLCVARDITEKKKIQVALEESRNNYLDLVRNSHESIITLDRHGYIISANLAAERLFGYHSDELKEKHFSKTGLIAESSLARTLQEFTFSILGWQRKPFEVQMTRKNSEPVLFSALFKVIRRDASHVSVQLILRDSAGTDEEDKRLSA